MARRPRTEERLADAADLDRRSTEEVLELIHREDRRALDAVGAVLGQVAAAVEILADVLAHGGRWINVGAGTSGRLGVLDASEIPPTFGLPPDRVVGVIAGGPVALRRAVEGAEDDGPAAARALRDLGLGSRDAVVAISASGTTPFAVAGLEAARRARARRIAITCDPASPLARLAEVAIVPEVGPEVVAGSTRMKGGLAQKAVLHMLSTATLVRLGRVRGNLMTHVQPASRKLRERAVGIVCELAGVPEETARALLERHGGSVAAALQESRGGRDVA